MSQNRTARLGLSGMATAAPGDPIVRALPADEFYRHGLNAEMRWEVMRDKEYTVPNASFFVRNHTSTPLIDAETWSLRVFGTGLRSAATAGHAVRFSHQGQAVPGTPWRLGAIGVAAWRGVPLSVVLDRSGITREAVDVMPYGLDPDLVMAAVS